MDNIIFLQQLTRSNKWKMIKSFEKTYTSRPYYLTFFYKYCWVILYPVITIAYIDEGGMVILEPRTVNRIRSPTNITLLLNSVSVLNIH